MLFEDEYHVKKSSLNINKYNRCEKYDGVLKCTEYETDYLIVNDEERYCKITDEIPSDTYYSEESEYFSCLIYNLFLYKFI